MGVNQEAHLLSLDLQKLYDNKIMDIVKKILTSDLYNVSAVQIMYSGSIPKVKIGYFISEEFPKKQRITQRLYKFLTELLK